MSQPFQTLLHNIDSPEKLIYGFIIILMIVYSSVIPSHYKSFANSILGRVFGIAIIYGIIQSLGWIYGLLTAIAFLFAIIPIKEGFEGGGTINQKKIIGDKWFVEKVLGEYPSSIETNKINNSYES